MAEDEGQRELDVRVGLGLAASEDQLLSLLAIAHQIDVPAKHVLYELGRGVTSVFQLVHGEVELRGDSSRTVEAGSSIGFSDFLIGRPYTDTATTLVPSRLLEVDAAEYREYLEDNFALASRLIVHTSERITAAALDRPALLASPRGPTTRSFANIEIAMVERLMMLSKMPVFRGASMQGLANLAQATSEARFAAGDEIIASGSQSSVVSFLVEGDVELALPTGASVVRSGRGLLAHVEELMGARRQCTVVAKSAAIALQIQREDMLDLLEEHFDLVLAVLAYLAGEQDKLV